jgi:excisionase family DNA binding protein
MAAYVSKKRVRAKDIAESNSISTDHVLDLFREGTIPGYKFGGTILFDPEEVDKALEAYHRKPKTVKGR